MARLPMTSVLGLGLISLGTIILWATLKAAVTHHRAEDSDVFGFLFGAVFALLGALFYFRSLQGKVALRSVTYAVLGANAGFGAMIAVSERDEWMDLWVFAMVPVYLGLVTGVVVQAGDVPAVFDGPLHPGPTPKAGQAGLQAKET